MWHVWPFVSSAHFSAATATASVYFLFALYCSAPPERFIFLQSWSWPPSFQCCTWHSGPQRRVLQRPHFLPNDKPSSVAQTAHCVRIISCEQNATGAALRCQKALSEG